MKIAVINFSGNVGTVSATLTVSGVTAAILWGVCHLVIRSGWRLKA